MSGISCLILSTLGAYTVFRILLHILTQIRQCVGSSLNLKKLGEWAVVTGSTDGIGKAYAFELAKRGLNIVLVSRTKAKLTAVATEIKEKYAVETKEVVADFTRTDIYDDIGAQLEGMDVGVLVNNVGMSYDHPEYLECLPQPHETVSALVNVNVMSMPRMVVLVLAGMKQRRRGLIINVASLSAVSPTPLLTLYAATKAFVVSFSEGLRLECAASNVHVQCVAPGFVATNMSKMKRTSLMAPSPATYVKAAMAKAGLADFTAGYWPHHLMMLGMQLLSEHVPGAGGRTLSYMLGLRKRALAKKEREAKAQ